MRENRKYLCLFLLAAVHENHPTDTALNFMEFVVRKMTCLFKNILQYFFTSTHMLLIYHI